MVVDVGDYMGLIVSEAERAFKKMFYLQKLYEMEDLIQEGIVAFYDAVKRHDASRGKLSTILVLVLRCNYINLLKKERVGSKEVSFDETDVLGYNCDYDSMIWMRQIEEQLSISSKRVFNCLLELDEEFVEWLKGRENSRGRKKKLMLLVEEFLGRSVLDEVVEIVQVIRK